MPLLDMLPSGLRSARVRQAVPGEPASLRADDYIPYTPSREGRLSATPQRDLASRLCGVAGCASGWLKPWKSRSRPVFEGDWGCSTRCLETLVSAAVRRETADALDPSPAAPHHHRVPLGLVLLAQGWITHPQLQKALAAQRSTGKGRIGEWLMQQCGLTEERIARGLGVQWNCPVLSLDGFSPRTMALLMPKRFVAEFGLVPVRFAASKILYLAFRESSQPGVSLGLERMCGIKVEPGLLPATQFEAARSQVLAAESVPVRMKLAANIDRLGAAIVRLLEQRQPVESRLIRVQNYYWLRFWLEESSFDSRNRVPIGTEDMEDHIFLIG